MNQVQYQRWLKIKELSDAGRSNASIGLEYGISGERVRQILNTLPTVGIKPRTPEQKAQYLKNKHREVRELAVSALGGKCAVCGMNDKRCLQIDHINGGGVQERKGISSYSLYKWIAKNPETALEKYQVLCANHNWIKRVENDEVIKRY